jgi:hypothetical protein
MTHRVRTNTGCNHRSDEPCSRCWYESQRGGHFQGAAPTVLLRPYIVSFPDELVMEHAFAAWERPHPVSSREELRRLCNERGVTSHYLRDSTVWRSGEQRWV